MAMFKLEYEDPETGGKKVFYKWVDATKKYTVLEVAEGHAILLAGEGWWHIEQLTPVCPTKKSGKNSEEDQ